MKKRNIFAIIAIIYLIIGFIVSIITTSLTAQTLPNQSFLEVYFSNIGLEIIIILLWPIFFGLQGTFS